MKRQVVLLTPAEISPSTKIIESLSDAGIALQIVTPSSAGFSANDDSQLEPVAILCEIASETRVIDLQIATDLSSAIWPGVPLVGCRSSADKSSAVTSDRALKRMGFCAVAEHPTQIAPLLRQVEEGPGTGELKAPPDFKSLPDKYAFSFPDSVLGEQMRGALSLLVALHLAANQKQAGQAALAGVARLIRVCRWTIFLCAETGENDALSFETLVARRTSEDEVLKFDEEWQSELLTNHEPVTEPESKTARAAATKMETIERAENGRHVIALPLISGERLIGVLEGIRVRRFSGSEISLLSTLAIPIGAALANSVRIAEAERLSLTDDLTRLHNARYLRQFLVNEIKRARRYGSSVAALFLDLDDFKLVNDQYGHLAGSHVLMEIASVILPSVRDTDCVVRYGGDEFVVILPETTVDDAVQVADRIRSKLEGHQFNGGRGLKVSLTASFGIAVFPQHALSPQQLIARADSAMYGAKAAQKNCVRVFSDAAETAPHSDPAPVPPGISQFQRFPDDKLIS